MVMNNDIIQSFISQKVGELERSSKLLSYLLESSEIFGDDNDTYDGIVNVLSRYLLIRACGILESVRDEIGKEYVRRTLNARVVKRYESLVGRSQIGVRPNQLCDFVRSFDDLWGSELNDFLEENTAGKEQRKGLLGSMVTERGNIVHGNGDTVTGRKSLTYVKLSMEIIQWLNNKFLPMG
jgi:hypothetical protein